jgi:chromosome segregation ATPase
VITDSRAAEIQDSPSLASLAEVAALAVTVQELRDDLALATQDVDQARRGLAELAADYARVTVRQQASIRRLQVERATREDRILELTAEMEGCHRNLDQYRRERQESADQIADLSGLVDSLRAELESRKSQQSNFADELGTSGAKLEEICSDLSKIVDRVRSEMVELYGSSGFYSASVLCDPKAVG